LLLVTGGDWRRLAVVTGGGGWWWWQVRQNLEKQIGVEDLGYLFWHQPIGR
jgi:hypothetical protein